VAPSLTSRPSQERLARARSESLQPLKVFPFGVSRKRLEQAVRDLGVPVTIINRAVDADLVLTLKSYYRSKPDALRDAESSGIPVYVLRSNTVAQMESALASVFSLPLEERDSTMSALEEAEQAIREVLDRSRSIEVSPQNAHIRRQQHALAERYNVGSRSRGKEPHRRVKFFPREYEGVF
jgi:R3H domain